MMPGMDKRQLAFVAAGAVAILFGVLVIVGQFLPPGSRLVSWPLVVVGAGAALFLVGAGTSAVGLVIPGAIVLGLGCLLYVQNLAGWWRSWSFAWTLVPGFTGLGLLAFARIHRASEGALRAAKILLLVSAALFLLFAAALGRHEWSWIALGVGLVGAGAVVVLRAARTGKARGGEAPADKAPRG
jgi:hypothetical protein